MAILGSTTLSDCNFIPDFIPSGSVMIFENSYAPTSWVKQTTYSSTGTALRVVGPTSGGVTGGLTPFSDILTQRSIGLSLADSANSGVTFNTVPANLTTVAVQAIGNFNVGATVADIPQHTHSFTTNDTTLALNSPGNRVMYAADITLSSTTTGSSGQHTHTVVVSGHSHTVNSPHTHTTTGTHNHPVVGFQEDFAVLYVDVIFASKS